MEHKTAKEKCQAWIEGSLGAEERRNVQQHLDDCGECRTHFEKISLLFERPHPTLLPRLAPDPFLPSRIRALAHERETGRGRRRAFGWVRLSVASVMLVVAAAAGIYLGKGLPTDTRTAEETELVEAYYEAFSPSDFTGVWEDLFVDAGLNGQQEGNR